MVYPCFSNMALHGGGHLELKQMHKEIFGASSVFDWGDVRVSFLKKSAFYNFIPGFSALALILT